MFGSKSEIFAALEIYNRYMSNAESVVRELFPYAIASGPELIIGNFVVSTSLHYNHLYGQMAPGQWAVTIQKMGTLPRIEYGFDLFSLFSSLYNASISGAIEYNYAAQAGKPIPYRAPIGPKEAFVVLSESLGILYAGAEKQPNSVNGWRKIRSPLYAVADFPLRIQPQIPGVCQEWYQYKNSTGATASFVFYYGLSDGGVVPVHVSLMRRVRGNQHQWLPVFPDKPFLLFNGDKIFASPGSDVVFCQDERTAIGLTQGQDIGTTVPGGMKNFLEADLTGLRGRRVILQLTHQDVEKGRLFREKLLQAGVLDPQFSLLGAAGQMTTDRQSFDALERVASEKGVSLSVPSSEKQSNSIRAIVARSGGPIPGGDVVLRTLLDPVIHEGDLVWLYADAKVGKSWLALALAQAVAAKEGELGKWTSSERWGVLYVDGEMKPSTLQRRIDKVLSNPLNPEKSRAFDLLSAKVQEEGFIRIDDERWQQEIERQLTGVHLLILDNFQSLTDNGVNTMMQIRSWLHHITSNKVAVLVIDHTNRDGDLQGSLAKVRNADLCIAMSVAGEAEGGATAAEDVDDAGGEGESVRILVEFPLGARDLYGDQIAPFVLERRISTELGLTFRLLNDAEVAAEDLISPKVKQQVRRAAAVTVLRGRKPPMGFRDMEAALGWGYVTLSKDYANRMNLRGGEKDLFDKCVMSFQGLDSDGMPPELWGVERSPRFAGAVE